MYRRLFHAMMEAFALHEIILDSRGEPNDFRFLEVNAEFERLTGLSRDSVHGRTMTEVFPNMDRNWLTTYARVSKTGVPARLEFYSPTLNKHLELSVFSVDESRIAALFVDISARVRTTEALKESEQRALRLIETLRRSEATLAALLDDKAALLKEVHHRVKNNLQVIVSLMNIERGRLDDAGAADDVLARMQDRVLAMAEVHDSLYRSAGPAAANFADALRSMADRLSDTYDSAARGILVTVADGELMLPLDLAVPCCLAMNELISNSLRYAFPSEWGGEKRVEIQMDVTSGGCVVLNVSDTGIGIGKIDEKDDDPEGVGGLRLAQLLADQLDGKLEISSEKGTTVRLSFSLP